jgi:hypothetical protein
MNFLQSPELMSEGYIHISKYIQEFAEFLSASLHTAVKWPVNYNFGQR